jgi:hypothetical protein
MLAQPVIFIHVRIGGLRSCFRDRNLALAPVLFSGAGFRETSPGEVSSSDTLLSDERTSHLKPCPLHTVTLASATGDAKPLEKLTPRKQGPDQTPGF